MPKLRLPRRTRASSEGQEGESGLTVPDDGLGAEAAEAAEAAESASGPELPARDDESVSVPSTDPPGWFRDDALGDVPDAMVGATPSAADEVAPIDADDPDAGDFGGVLPPGTIYRTVPPLPEGAAARPRRRSPMVSVLVGLLILVVVGVGGFGIGMLLPLLLPLPAGSASVTSPGPTVAAPSATPGTSAATSPSATGAASPLPSVAPSPAATPRIYVVKRGDQLGRIAASFGVTLQALQAANGITNPNLIIPGQKLVIPAPAASPVPSASASPVASPSTAP